MNKLQQENKYTRKRVQADYVQTIGEESEINDWIVLLINLNSMCYDQPAARQWEMNWNTSTIFLDKNKLFHTFFMHMLIKLVCFNSVPTWNLSLLPVCKFNQSREIQITNMWWLCWWNKSKLIRNLLLMITNMVAITSLASDANRILSDPWSITCVFISFLNLAVLECRNVVTSFPFVY